MVKKYALRMKKKHRLSLLTQNTLTLEHEIEKKKQKGELLWPCFLIKDVIFLYSSNALKDD